MIFEDLTEEQKKLVTAPTGNICCFAVAGSGKTESIAFRALYLLERGYQPDEILLLTFSNKAAREMSSRVNALVATNYNEIINFEAFTFHRLGLFLSRQYPHLLDIKPDFVVIDKKGRDPLMEQARSEIVARYKIKGLPKYTVISEIYSGTINHNDTFDEYMKKFYKIKNPSHLMAINQIFKRYIELKKENNLIDLDDLLLNALDLLQKDIVRQNVVSHYKTVLVDEYQDINWVQHDIIRLLNANNNTLVIGDKNQTIFEWRGSKDKYIENFPNEFPDVTTYYLTANFRSTQPILDFAADSINHNEQERPVELVSRIPFFNPQLPMIFEGKTMEDLYNLAADDILCNFADDLQNTVVLLRYNADCETCQHVFEKRGIACATDSALLLSATKYFKDIDNFLKFINAPEDCNFKFILRLFGIVKKPEEFVNILKKNNYDFHKDIVFENPTLQSKFNKLKELFFTKELTIAEQIEVFMQNFYSKIVYKTITKSEQAFEDINHIITQAKTFRDYKDFVDYFAVNNDLPAASTEHVKITTVHRAKGLEWNHVYLLGVNDNFFPKNNEDLSNERKLFYVACTRARTDLIIGFYSKDTLGNDSYPSIFLEEINRDLYIFDGN